VLELPESYPSDFEMGKLTVLCDWLGYTEAFCQFSRRGWFLALLGAFSILVSSCIAERPDQRRVTHVIRVVIVTGGAAAAIAWTLPFCAGWHVRCAETCVRQGQYENALIQLDRAEQLLPILRYDTYLIVQRGCLYDQIGQSYRPEAVLYRATIREREGRLIEANKLYRALMRDAAPDSPCRREACRAILRDAIHALNSGAVEPAMAELHEVLQADPTNIKAIYALQLACVRSGKRDEVVNLAARLEVICARYQHPIKDTVRSASHHNNFVSALDQDDLTSAVEAYQKAQAP
jgi:tetratricopeptide (TPR) repeat protein